MELSLGGHQNGSFDKCEAIEKVIFFSFLAGPLDNFQGCYFYSCGVVHVF